MLYFDNIAFDMDNRILLTWRTHRMREEPWRLAALIPLIALTFFSASRVFESQATGAVITAVLFFTLADYFFPVTYKITERTASSKVLISRQEILWENVKTAWEDSNGVKLSPLKGRSRREAFRGVYLRYSNNREQVLELVRQLGPPSKNTVTKPAEQGKHTDAGS